MGGESARRGHLIMRIIKQLSRMIEEELSDAEKYARNAVEQKAERPELAKTFVTLANAELEHMQLLHNAVAALIEKERQEHGDPPPGMLEAYGFIHELQFAHAAEVRSLVQLAQG